MQLILASTSVYRQQLLQQLRLPFEIAAPRFEEVLSPEVAPELLARHLALGKAQSLQQEYPQALILAADQLFVDFRGRPVGKPGNFEAAARQLQHMAGRTLMFYTGVALVDAAQGEVYSDYVSCEVAFRPLSEAQIQQYLQLEEPFDCAGAFKAEGLGIALLERLTGDDYTALLGLPLTRVCDLLQHAGVDILAQAARQAGIKTEA